MRPALHAGTALAIAPMTVAHKSVMAIVDVYDAAVTRTLYRRTMSHDDTVKFIAAGKGTHFDPAVADAFVKVSSVIPPVFGECRWNSLRVFGFGRA